MFIGILKIEIFIPYTQSLKEKRQVMNKAIDNLKNRYPISIAEVDEQDKWQKGVIGISLVSSNKKFLESLLDKIISYIETNFDFNIIEIEREIISW